MLSALHPLMYDKKTVLAKILFFLFSSENDSIFLNIIHDECDWFMIFFPSFMHIFFFLSDQLLNIIRVSHV